MTGAKTPKENSELGEDLTVLTTHAGEIGKSTTVSQ